MIPAQKYFVRPVVSLFRFILKASLPPVRRLLLMFYALSGCLMLMCSCKDCIKETSLISAKSGTYEESVLVVTVSKIVEIDAPPLSVNHDIFYLEDENSIGLLIQIRNETNSLLSVSPVKVSSLEKLFFEEFVPFNIAPNTISETRFRVPAQIYEDQVSLSGQTFQIAIYSKGAIKGVININVNVGKTSTLTAWGTIVKYGSLLLLLAIVVYLIVTIHNYTRNTDSINPIKAITNFSVFEARFNNMKSLLERTATENEQLKKSIRELEREHLETDIKNDVLNNKLQETEKNSQEEIKKLKEKLKLNEDETVRLFGYNEQLKLENAKIEKARLQEKEDLRQLILTMEKIFKEDLKNDQPDITTLNERIKETNLYKLTNKVNKWRKIVTDESTPVAIGVMLNDMEIKEQHDELRLFLSSWNLIPNTYFTEEARNLERKKITDGVFKLISEIERKNSAGE